MWGELLRGRAGEECERFSPTLFGLEGGWRSEATAILKGEAYRLFYVHKNKFNIIRFIIITSWDEGEA